MSDFTHYTLMAGGELVADHTVRDASAGPSVLWLKIWAMSVEDAVDTMCDVGNEAGFRIIKDVEVFKTAAEQPAREQSFAYDIRFVPAGTPGQ